ncbi:MAG: cyclic-phosphate processing receiver domain-containing protein [Planctomycetaceae bacterium]
MPIIAVLEDEQRRISAIRTAARQYFVGCELRIFVSAREMIAWLSTVPSDVCILSLDCDLDLSAVSDNQCGTGEDVTAYLASDRSDYSVLIHSSNAMRAPAMHMELILAGCRRVALCPFKDSDSWAADVRAHLDSTRTSH